MSGIELWKMSGAGNDFIVLEAQTPGPIDPDWVRRVCRRGVSVGSDGVLLVGLAPDKRVAVRFFNPDGSEAFCGNGSRCAARYASLRGLAGDSMTLDTVVGDVPARVEGDRVALDLPAPRDLGPVDLTLDAASVEARRVDAGVPHVVLFVEHPVAEAPLESWGPEVRSARRFAPAGTNFNVARIVGQERIDLRTWERGVERETLSCGSGAVAAALAGRLRGAAESVRVLPTSGIPLNVRLAGAGDRKQTVELSGDARVVFRAVLDEEATRGFSV